MLEVNSLIRSGLLMLLATPVAAHSQSTAQDGFSIVGRPFYDSSGHEALSVVTQNITRLSPTPTLSRDVVKGDISPCR